MTTTTCTITDTPTHTRFQNWMTLTSPSRLETLASEYAPISLQQMDSVALLDRSDTKYVMTKNQLMDALAALPAYYQMLSIQDQRLNHYRTLYFDTDDFQLYTAHVNGRTERYKVRSREYTDSHLSFLEVKHKTIKDRTIKDRILTDQPALWVTSDLNDWLRGYFPLDGSILEPKLWNTFTRITLVNTVRKERVTLDVDLAFYTSDEVAYLDGVAVAEVKTDGDPRNSPFYQKMRSLHIQPRGFSKYSIGVSMLYNDVKKNTLKPTLLQLDKMMKGYANDERPC